MSENASKIDDAQPDLRIPHSLANSVLRVLATMFYLYPAFRFGLGSFEYLGKGPLSPALVLLGISGVGLVLSIVFIWTGSRRLTVISFLPVAAYFAVTSVFVPAFPLPSIGAVLGIACVALLVWRK